MRRLSARFQSFACFTCRFEYPWAHECAYWLSSIVSLHSLTILYACIFNENMNFIFCALFFNRLGASLTMRSGLLLVFESIRLVLQYYYFFPFFFHTIHHAMLSCFICSSECVCVFVLLRRFLLFRTHQNESQVNLNTYEKAIQSVTLCLCSTDATWSLSLLCRRR